MISLAPTTSVLMTWPLARPTSNNIKIDIRWMTPIDFRYIPLEINDTARWDIAVEKADKSYEKQMHNICW